MNTSRSPIKLVNYHSRTRKKLSPPTTKDQFKITTYFSPTNSIKTKEEKSTDSSLSLTNGVHVNIYNASPEFINASSPISISTNVKLQNGNVVKSTLSSIRTRSQSQKMKSTFEHQSKNYFKSEVDIPTKNMINTTTSPTNDVKISSLPHQSKPSDIVSPTLSPPMSSLTPHKIQALNEAKLRLDSPLSNSPVSKLKAISPKKHKFSKKISGRKKNNYKTASATVDKMTKPLFNGALKSNSSPTMKNMQMTQFFPIRRSHRKPKTTLLQEKKREFEEKILSGTEKGLEVDCYQLKGRGVKTTQFFKKGEMVVEYVGDLIDMKEAKEREKNYSLDSSKGCYMYYFTFQNTQYCIDATEESGYLGRLVNHSRQGNLATKAVEVNGRPHLIFMAKKDLEPGTEILYDYGDRSKQSLLHHPWLAL